MAIDWEQFDKHQEPYEGRITSRYSMPKGKDLEALTERLQANPGGIVLDERGVSMLFSIEEKSLPKPRSIVQSTRKRMARLNIGVGLVGADKEGQGGKIRLRLKEPK